MKIVIETLLVFALGLGLPGIGIVSLVARGQFHSVQKPALWTLLTSNVLIVVWIWIYFTDGAFGLVKTVSLSGWFVASAISIVVVPNRVLVGPSPKNVIRNCCAVLIIGVVAIAFYLVPRTLGEQVTQRQLMGPDAIGYANAVAGVLEDGSFNDLKQSALAASGHNLMYELFDQDIQAVYQIPEKSLSIKAEFIVGSLRVGLPGVAALFTDRIGIEHLLTVMNLLATVYVAVGGLLIYGLLRSSGAGNFLSLSISSLSMININLLVGFHEGGVAQAFMFAALAAFLVAALQEEISITSRIGLFLFAAIHALSSYLDMYFVFVALSIIWLAIALLKHDSKSVKRAWYSLCGFALSLLMLLPLTIHVPRYMLRRLADARQGGWNWDSWTELGGLLGVTNPYAAAPDSILMQLLLVGLGIYVYQTRISVSGRKLLQPSDSVLTAIVLLSIGFYIYTRYLMEHTTYQWFKLSGTLIGPSLLPLLTIWLAARRKDWKRDAWTTVLLVSGVLALSLSTSLQYVRHYWGESQALPTYRVSEISDKANRDVLKQYQLFGQYGWEELALTPFWPGTFLNRDDYGKRPIPNPEKRVGLLVREEYCPSFECLGNVSRSKKLKIGSELMIVDLDLLGNDIRSLSPYLQWVRVNRALNDAGAPYVEGDWSTLGPTLRFEG